MRSVRRVLKRRPVEFAYLFGSRARGRARASSDVDLAAFLSPRLTPRRRERERLLLLGELCSALRRDAVDLVILNDAPPLLAFRVTATGRTIYSRDELCRIRFEARAMAMYYDRLPADERSAELMLRRVSARGLRR